MLQKVVMLGIAKMEKSEMFDEICIFWQTKMSLLVAKSFEAYLYASELAHKVTPATPYRKNLTWLTKYEPI